MKQIECKKCMLSIHRKGIVKYRSNVNLKANMLFIVDAPTIADEATGIILSQQEVDLLEFMLAEVSHIQSSISLSYIIAPMVLCRPIDFKTNETMIGSSCAERLYLGNSRRHPRSRGIGNRLRPERTG